MLRYCLIGAIALQCAGFATASTSFNYTGSNVSPSASSITETLGGITATATGVWANVNNSGATVTGTGNTFGVAANGSAAWLAEYQSDGLGVCNPNEQSGCPAPQHQIDNLNGIDFVNFSFSTAVTLSDVNVVGFGNPTGVNGSYNDVDLSYAILTSAQETSLLAGTLVFSTVNFTTFNTNFFGYNDYSLSGTGQYVLIGAAVTPYYGDSSASQATPDAFKIQYLDVTAAPEPASFILIGSGLMVGALFGRRRTRNKTNS